jgi:hypothetical protein
MRRVLGSWATSMLGAAALTVGVWATPAGAAIIYVDATDGAAGNTALAPSAGGGVWTTNTTDTVDAIWRFRTGFGLAPTATSPPSGAGSVTTGGAGTVYESTGNTATPDDVPRVVTTVSGLPSDTYNVYVYFWSDQSNSPWRVRAGLTDDPNPLSLYLGSNTPSGTPTPVNIATDSGGRIFYQVLLGQQTGTSLSVFVEDGPATGGTSRTWYDGIGYESAIPEPASLAALGLGGLALLHRRRR